MFSKSILCLLCYVLFSFGCHAYNDIPTDDTNIERPCRLYDMFCIRQFFVKHSHCKEALGPIPTPFYRPQYTVYLPRINLTITALKAEYYGLNGRIQEFYFNKKTDKLVLAVEFTELTVGSNENYFRFHRRAKEPIVNEGLLNVTYSSMVITILIPNLKNLQLQDSEAFTYSNDANPRFAFGPQVFLSSDPQVPLTALAFLANIPANIQEGFLTDVQFYIYTFIKYNICDFGLEPL